MYIISHSFRLLNRALWLFLRFWNGPWKRIWYCSRCLHIWIILSTNHLTIIVCRFSDALPTNTTVPPLIWAHFRPRAGTAPAHRRSAPPPPALPRAKRHSCWGSPMGQCTSPQSDLPSVLSTHHEMFDLHPFPQLQRNFPTNLLLWVRFWGALRADINYTEISFILPKT